MKGVPLQDIFDDIPPISAQSAERLGYPTQKPLALLERIIASSTDKRSIVLDPFCGCGTTIDAAQKLGCKWIGIDVTHIATNLIKFRLKNRHHLKEGVDYRVLGEPKDLSSAKELASQDRYQFEWWALGLVEATPYQDKKKGADTGVDGICYFQDGKKVTDLKSIVDQVKSGNVSVKDIRELNTVVDNKKAATGILITLRPPTKPMMTEAASKGFYEYKITKKRYAKIQILTIEELLAGKQIESPPTMPFTKKAESVGDSHTQGKLI
ncbi:MAG: restriction endonuclease [Deltaproteobacteria bacterium]|nr:restriction endonuclease [Deltaproteobacteria bacterium]